MIKNPRPTRRRCVPGFGSGFLGAPRGQGRGFVALGGTQRARPFAALAHAAFPVRHREPLRAAPNGVGGWAARAGGRLQLRRCVGARNVHTPKRAAARAKTTAHHGGAAGGQHRAQSACCGAGAPPALGCSVLPRPPIHGDGPASFESLRRSLPPSLAISPSSLSRVRRVRRVVSSVAHNI